MKAAILLLAAPALLFGCGEREARPEPIRPVLAMTVQPGAAATRDVYSGEIRARYETDLAFRVGGKLVARMADAGERVKRGQVLARLDAEDARLGAQAAAAQLASAESDLAVARAELERHEELLARKFISDSAFDAKRNAYNAAKARAEQARSQATLTANQAAYTTLVADADGVVVSVAAQPGQVLAAGQPVLRLARAGDKEVVIDVPEGRLATFAPGKNARVSLWAEAGQPFPGRVREVAGGADPVTRTYAVRVAVPQAPAHAQLGMTASVAFEGAEDAALVVLPLAALARAGGAPAVWRVDPASGRVSLRPVSVGQFREDGVTITGGLSAGDVVVTAGVHKLRDGQQVRIAEAPAARPPQASRAP